jgi:hypothetical protein
MRGLCRKSRRLVDASSMWAILEAELNKANTFNVCSHGEYFDEDCRPFRFRTMLRQEKRELALEIRKLSSDECTKVVHIIKKERLFGKVLSRCSVSEIEDDLDSLFASTQSEIVLFMHGLHPGKGMLRDQQLKRKGHSRDNEECTCRHLDHGMFPNSQCPAMEIRERLDDSPSWYREYEIAQGFVDDERRHNSLTSKDPRIHPTFAALSPLSRCRNLVTFSRKVVLALQANVAFKPPFHSWRTDVSFVLHPYTDTPSLQGASDLMRGPRRLFLHTNRLYVYPSHLHQSASSKTRTHAHTQWDPPNPCEDDEEQHEWIAGLWRLYGHPSDDGSMRYLAMVGMIGQLSVCLSFSGPVVVFRLNLCCT